MLSSPVLSLKSSGWSIDVSQFAIPFSKTCVPLVVGMATTKMTSFHADSRKES